MNVIAYAGRPFHDVGSMNAMIIAAWNAAVAPDDEVWILGDLAMGRITETLPLAQALAGHKHLLLGNHDRPFEDNQRRAEWTQRYLDDGGLTDLHHGIVTLDLASGVGVRLCHFPYDGDSGDRDRYVEERPPDDGMWLLHGHVHEKWRQRGHMINVGVDAWAGQPVSEGTLIELIDAGGANLPPHPWS